jgi:hypothetical protein
MAIGGLTIQFSIGIAVAYVVYRSPRLRVLGDFTVAG